MRELHDLTAGTALAGDSEVVCHHDIDAGARAGEPAMVRLAELGVPDDVRRQATWTAEHAEELARLL